MKITVTLPKGSGIMLQEFCKLKLCGDSLEENASYLMMRAISDLASTVGFRHLTEALKKRLETPTATIVPLKAAEPAPALVAQETEGDRLARENWEAANKVTSTSAPASVTATIEKPALIKSQEHNAPTILASAALLPTLTPGQAAVLKVYREAAGAVRSLREVAKAAGVPLGSASFHRDALVDKGYATAEKLRDGQTAIKVIVDESVPISKPKTKAAPLASEDTQKSAARALGDEIVRDEPPAEAPPAVAEPVAVLIDDLSVRMKILMRGILTFGVAPPRTTAQLSRHSSIEESKLPFLLNRLRELKLIEGSIATKWILTPAGVELAKQVPSDLSLNGGKPETKLSFPIVRIQDTTPAASKASRSPTFGKTLTDAQREAIDKHMATKGARTFEPGASAEPWLMQEQLQKKGHIVSRNSGGRWIVDGKIKDHDDVVALINKYRAAVDLPPLTAPAKK